jgi:hypothetical protein
MSVTIGLFQTQPHVWADVAYQAVLTLGPALITAGVTWLAFRSQLKLKDKEIAAQAKLKARELMFNSYQVCSNVGKGRLLRSAKCCARSVSHFNLMTTRRLKVGDV